MSEFTNKRKQKFEKIKKLALAIINNDNVLETFNNIRETIDNQLEPLDIVEIVDYMYKLNIQMNDLKKAVNKILNLFYKRIYTYETENPEKGSFLWFLMQNNLIVEKKLESIKPLVKQMNQKPNDTALKKQLIEKFTDIEKFTNLYTLKENALFPAVEQYLQHYDCIKVMWSFHDDIRRNLKKLLNHLKNEQFDLKLFNRVTADIFFNIRAITFRDNKILFPVIYRLIPEAKFNEMMLQAAEIKFPYLNPKKIEAKTEEINFEQNLVKLPTGTLTVEQIALIFNHLPLDLTFVDEHNKVKYFSQPKSRIFPRTIGVIGRDVKNCHPPESVHIVEKIVEKFRSGEEDVASFWINMGPKYVLIKYFAIRDEQGNYKGVLEVSQEIQDIVQLKGEKRLLDWEN